MGRSGWGWPGVRWSALGLFLLALIGGCATSPAATPIVFDEDPGWDPGPDVGGKALRDEVFSDGEVTFDEYERAVTAAVQCMRDAGFDVEGPLQYPDGGIVVVPGWDPRLRLGIRAHPGEDPQDIFGDVNGRCQAQWSWHIEQVWFQEHEPTEAETQAWLERAWECAGRQGAPIASPPTVEDALNSVAYGCRPWETDE
jgi:hypothetical protein